MKLFTVFILAISFSSFSQTGSVVCDIEFEWDNDSIPINAVLTSKSDTIRFQNVYATDTLKNIKAGYYNAFFYCCDSSYMHGEIIKVESDHLTTVSYYNSFDYDIDDYNYINEGDVHYYGESYFNGGFQLGMGTEDHEDFSELGQNYFIRYHLGMDYLLGNSPFGLGFETGLEYNHTFLGKTDFYDEAISHQRQRLSYINYSASFLMSIYIKDRKIMDFGLSYHLPIRTKVVVIDGNQKTYHKNVHDYNDFRFFAHVGYWWGFAFAEYRPVRFMKAPFQDTPRFNIGLRVNFPGSYY